MILKHDVLVNINNYDNLIYVELFLEKIKNTYIIKFSLNGGKTHIKSVDINELDLLQRDPIYILQKSESEYRKKLNTYLKKKYKNLTTFTKKSINELDSQDINKIKSFYRKTETGIPKPMLPASYDDVASDIFENDFYWSPIISGIRCLIYYRNNNIQIYTPEFKTNKKLLEKIRHLSVLKNFFKKYPDEILDSIIQIPSLSSTESRKLLKKRCFTIPDIALFIIDVVKEIPCEDRVLLLQNWESELSNNKVFVVISKPVSGWFRITNRLNKMKREGYPGIILKGAHKIYESGKRISMGMIKIHI